MEKITNRGTGGTAHEEQCETDHRGGREKWKLLLIPGAGKTVQSADSVGGPGAASVGGPGAASQHPLRVALSHLQLQLQGI